MTIHPAPEDKRSLRQRLRKLRAGISPGERRRAGRRLCRLALRHRLLARGRRSAFYLPAKGEIDIRPLIAQARRMGVSVYLPVVPTAAQRKLFFTRLGRAEHWRENRYGIAEYGLRNALRLRASAMQQVFLPMLGFDRRGFRLGMGGGYYDASLAFLARRRFWKKPRLIGVAFAVQAVAKVPNEAWDIRLDLILTEQALQRAADQ
jgi:5-formyltetrahydrofolate cyclo-ligase